MKTIFLGITPVLPSQNIIRDIKWYKEKIGFDCIHGDERYAVLKRENLLIHLQWHADNESDPLIGGSVIKIFVKNIDNIYTELKERGSIKPNNQSIKTAWKTNEFGLYDLNKNAIFFVEDI